MALNVAIGTLDYSRCKPNILDRFWSKVDRSGDCWEWLGSKLKSGYGNFGPYKGKNMLAHRFIEIAFNGDLDDGQIVMHKCDNPSCVRPSHLVRGSLKDNTQDMKSKGRDKPPIAPRGESHHSCVLTEGMVREIYSLRKSGKPLAHVADTFGVSITTVSSIARGKKWKHLDLGGT